MEFWQQILMAAVGLLFLFFIFPSIKSSMQRSRNAQEKHWGTVLLLAAALIAFVAFLVFTVR